MFSNCDKLTHMTIAEDVTRIADNAFNGCSTLKTVTLLGSVTSIGEETFAFCSDELTLTVQRILTRNNTTGETG